MGPITKTAITIYLVFAIYAGFSVMSVTYNNSQVIATTINFSAHIHNINITYDVLHYPDGNVSYRNFTVKADIVFDARGAPLDVEVYDMSYTAAIFTEENGVKGMKSVGSFHFYTMDQPIVVKSGEVIVYNTTVNITDPYFMEIVNRSYNSHYGSWTLSGGLNYQISSFEKLPKNSITLMRGYIDKEVMQ